MLIYTCNTAKCTWLETERETDEQQMVGCAMQKSHATELEKHTHTSSALCTNSRQQQRRLASVRYICNMTMDCVLTPSLVVPARTNIHAHYTLQYMMRSVSLGNFFSNKQRDLPQWVEGVGRPCSLSPSSAPSCVCMCVLHVSVWVHVWQSCEKRREWADTGKRLIFSVLSVLLHNVYITKYGST